MAREINIKLNAEYIASLYDALETSADIEAIIQTIEENQDALLDMIDDNIIMIVDANREKMEALQ